MDGDVNKLLTSWQVPTREFNKTTPVTPRSLFSHTSGADDGLGFPGYAPAQPLPTLLQILAGEKPANTKAVTFARPPFVAAKYSGSGLTIMQREFDVRRNSQTPGIECVDQNHFSQEASSDGYFIDFL